MEEEKTTTEVVETSPATPAEPPVTSEKPKNNKGLIATTIIACVLAVAGIAGAIYFYLDANNKAAETTKLKAELNLVKQETGANIVEQEENGNTVATVEVLPENYGFLADNFTGSVQDAKMTTKAYYGAVFSLSSDGTVSATILPPSCEYYNQICDANGDAISKDITSSIPGKAIDISSSSGYGNGGWTWVFLTLEDGSVVYFTDYELLVNNQTASSVENSKNIFRTIDGKYAQDTTGRIYQITQTIEDDSSSYKFSLED